MSWAHRYWNDNGYRTHYLEAGEGPPVVLLHGGEYGADAEVTWTSVMDVLATTHRVIAMDFFGYGHSDKIRDLRGQRRRQTEQVSRLVSALALGDAHVVGTSMSGRLLLEAARRRPAPLPMRSLTAIGVGLFPPSGPAHRKLFDYDGTLDGLRDILPLLFVDPRFTQDEEYLRFRYDHCTIPGAWEFGAASRLRRPGAEGPGSAPQPTAPSYESIELPTCLVLGEQDSLVPRDSWDQLVAQVPHAVSHVVEGVGHYPQVEEPGRVADILLEFFGDVDG